MNKIINDLKKEHNITTEINIDKKPKYGNTYDICIYLKKNGKIIGRITAHDSPLYKDDIKEKYTDSLGILAINPEFRGLNLGYALICLLKHVYEKNNLDAKYLILSPSDKDLEKFIKHGGKFENLHKYRGKNKFKLLQFYEKVGFKLIDTQVMKVNINELKCINLI